MLGSSEGGGDPCPGKLSMGLFDVFSSLLGCYLLVVLMFML